MNILNNFLLDPNSFQILSTLLGFLIGVCLGSFTKVLADRSLNKKSFLGRSACTHCHHKLAVLDLIPLFSYLFLKGKCRYCYKKISKEYFLVELVCGALVAILFYQSQLNLESFNNPWQLVVTIYSLIFKTLVIVVLVAVCLTDLKKTIIPDRITFPAIIVAFLGTIVITLYKIFWLYSSLNSSTLGKFLLPPHSDYFTRHAQYTAEPLFGSIIMGVAIGLFFLTLIVVTKGRGMGGGDLKLGIFLGLVFGFPQSLLVLMLSFLLGSIVGVILLVVKKRQLGQTIPFGPFLSVAGIITLFWGEQIIDWYLRLRPF